MRYKQPFPQLSLRSKPVLFRRAAFITTRLPIRVGKRRDLFLGWRRRRIVLEFHNCCRDHPRGFNFSTHRRFSFLAFKFASCRTRPVAEAESAFLKAHPRDVCSSIMSGDGLSTSCKQSSSVSELPGCVGKSGLPRCSYQGSIRYAKPSATLRLSSHDRSQRPRTRWSALAGYEDFYVKTALLTGPDQADWSNKRIYD